MSIFIGQTYRQRQHMVQNHGQFDFAADKALPDPA
jgi:hypothetical protein